jgi:sigma-54 dependent transcriptional regulator, flagellar regulatory protein
MKIKLDEQGIDLTYLLECVERDLIEQALKKASTSAGAARLLGLKRTTLVEKRKKYRLPIRPKGRLK